MTNKSACQHVNRRHDREVKYFCGTSVSACAQRRTPPNNPPKRKVRPLYRYATLQLALLSSSWALRCKLMLNQKKTGSLGKNFAHSSGRRMSASIARCVNFIETSHRKFRHQILQLPPKTKYQGLPEDCPFLRGKPGRPKPSPTPPAFCSQCVTARTPPCQPPMAHCRVLPSPMTICSRRQRELEGKCSKVMVSLGLAGWGVGMGRGIGGVRPVVGLWWIVLWIILEAAC